MVTRVASTIGKSTSGTAPSQRVSARNAGRRGSSRTISRTAIGEPRAGQDMAHVQVACQPWKSRTRSIKRSGHEQAGGGSRSGRGGCNRRGGNGRHGGETRKGDRGYEEIIEFGVGLSVSLAAAHPLQTLVPCIGLGPRVDIGVGAELRPWCIGDYSEPDLTNPLVTSAYARHSPDLRAQPVCSNLCQPKSHLPNPSEIGEQ